MNSPETMDKYIHESFSMEKLAQELGSTYCKFYFAYLDSELAGYIKINYAPVQSDINDLNQLKLREFMYEKNTKEMDWARY